MAENTRKTLNICYQLFSYEITIHFSCIITSSQSISHSVTISILTGIDHSSNVKQHGGISGVAEKLLSCQLQNFCIINYTIYHSLVMYCSYDSIKIGIMLVQKFIVSYKLNSVQNCMHENIKVGKLAKLEIRKSNMIFLE